jgi:hypothetical protein
MTDIEVELDQLEQSLNKCEEPKQQSANMPSNMPKISVYYMYGIAAIIPVILTGIFYLTKPKMIMKKNKILWQKMFQWVAIITVILWIIMYGVYFYCYK